MKEHQESLAALRGEIDVINEQLLALIQQRGELVLEIARVKQAGGLEGPDPEREADILRRLTAHTGGPFGASAIRIPLSMLGLLQYLAPVFQFGRVNQPLFQRAQLRIVQISGNFLAIAGNEGHGGTFIQQRDRCGHLIGVDTEFSCNDLDDFLLYCRCFRAAHAFGFSPPNAFVRSASSNVSSPAIRAKSISNC